jgi:N-methylhydantoinase B
MIHMIQAFGQVPPMELWEAKFPWLIERYEFATDSCGPGEHVGGQGIDISWRMLEDCFFTSTVEQTTTKAWGLGGGVGGRSNYAQIALPDGTTKAFGKVTAMKAPKGSVVSVRSGGGGGYGQAHKRDRLAILADIRKGLMTEEFARKHFAQAFRPLSKAS